MSWKTLCRTLRFWESCYFQSMYAEQFLVYGIVTVAVFIFALGAGFVFGGVIGLSCGAFIAFCVNYAVSLKIVELRQDPEALEVEAQNSEGVAVEID